LYHYSEACTAAQKQLDGFLASLPAKSKSAGDGGLTMAGSLEGFTADPSKAYISVPTLSNYCAASFNTVSYTHEDSAPLFLLGQVGLYEGVFGMTETFCYSAQVESSLPTD
jgi:hypothetical protein